MSSIVDKIISALLPIAVVVGLYLVYRYLQDPSLLAKDLFAVAKMSGIQFYNALQPLLEPIGGALVTGEQAVEGAGESVVNGAGSLIEL